MDLTQDEFIRFKNGALLLQSEFPQIESPTACYYEGQLVSIYAPHPIKKRLIKTNKNVIEGEKNANNRVNTPL